MDNKGEFIDLSQHAAEQLFSKDDLIILQPKCPLVLPLLPSNRFPVSESDIKNHVAIVELAYTRGIQKYYLCAPYICFMHHQYIFFANHYFFDPFLFLCFSAGIMLSCTVRFTAAYP